MGNQLFLTMNDGHKIPVVGLGTWKSEPGDSTYNAVLNSIKAGYRHIDTARAYDNESDVGRAVKDADIGRKDLFITTKLWNKDQGYDTAIER
jgi:diketogulonate reductase-like aldo/keto reductase